MTLAVSEAQRALAATVADAPASAAGQTERDALHARFAPSAKPRDVALDPRGTDR